MCFWYIWVPQRHYFTMCIFQCVSGIFAYLNYLVPATREEILKILINGLKRMEYRGYDSAGTTIMLTN